VVVVPPLEVEELELVLELVEVLVPPPKLLDEDVVDTLPLEVELEVAPLEVELDVAPLEVELPPVEVLVEAVKMVLPLLPPPKKPPLKKPPPKPPPAGPPPTTTAPPPPPAITWGAGIGIGTGAE
jgi:hypothetical protein